MVSEAAAEGGVAGEAAVEGESVNTIVKRDLYA